MKKFPQEYKEEIVDYIIDLQKGLIDNPKWDFDLDTCDWQAYQKSFLDPTNLRTTLSIWLNHLKLNGDEIGNWEYARYRSHQYFRSFFDKNYEPEQPFEQWEIEEPY